MPNSRAWPIALGAAPLPNVSGLILLLRLRGPGSRGWLHGMSELFLAFALLLFAKMMARDATADRSQNRVVSRIMPCDGPGSSAGEAADRVGGRSGHRTEGDDGDKSNFNGHSWSLSAG
jgi:hypothetical protein